MLLCVASRCWTRTNAIPVSGGICLKNFSNASRPPAEAPSPMIGKSRSAGGGATSVPGSTSSASSGKRFAGCCFGGVGLLLFLSAADRIVRALACAPSPPGLPIEQDPRGPLGTLAISSGCHKGRRRRRLRGDSRRGRRGLAGSAAHSRSSLSREALGTSEPGPEPRLGCGSRAHRLPPEPLGELLDVELRRNEAREVRPQPDLATESGRREPGAVPGEEPPLELALDLVEGLSLDSRGAEPEGDDRHPALGEDLEPARREEPREMAGVVARPPDGSGARGGPRRTQRGPDLERVAAAAPLKRPAEVVDDAGGPRDVGGLGVEGAGEVGLVADEDRPGEEGDEEGRKSGV